MKLIIAGSRDFTDYKFLERELELLDARVTEVVCGCARGADELGHRWAVAHGKDVKMFPAKWDDHGRAAGPIRNAEMANYADEAIVFCKNKSKGSMNMIKAMQLRKKPVLMYYLDSDGELISNGHDGYDVRYILGNQAYAPKATLEQLVAKCDLSAPISKEEQEWFDMPSVGNERID